MTDSEGRMARGYLSDEALCPRIEDLMARTPGLVQADAIRHFVDDANRRRLEQKLKARRDARTAAARAEVAVAHAAEYPAVAMAWDGSVYFAATVPRRSGAESGPGADLGASYGKETVVLGLDLAGGLGKGLVGGVFAMGDAPPADYARALAIPEGAWAAAASLGVFDPGPSAFAKALGSALVRAWAVADLDGHSAEDLDEAVRSEALRLSEAGLADVVGAMSPDAAKVLSCFRHVAPAGVLARTVAPGMEPARLRLLHRLAPFACADMAMVDEKEAEGWVDRPLEYLHGVLARQAVRHGLREWSLREVAWLDDLLRPLARAVAPAAVRLMLRWMPYVDPARCVDVGDALALARLAEAVAFLAEGPSDPVLGHLTALLFERLCTGPDAASGYGKATASLVDGDTASGLADVVLTLTCGAEALCREVAERLVVPSLALVAASVGADAWDGVLDADGRWAGMLEGHVREVVFARRRLSDLVAVAAGIDLGAQASRRFRLGREDFASPVVVFHGDADADAAWDAFAPRLGHRQAAMGRRAVEDRFADLLDRSRLGEDDVHRSPVARRVRRRVDGMKKALFP